VRVRHQRRVVLAGLAALLGGMIQAMPGTPATAATNATVAGTGIATTGGTPLKMRREPSTAAQQMGTVANGGTIWIMCQAAGDRVAGTVRTTAGWLRLANNTYVSDAYVRRAAFTIPACAPATTVSGSWQLPVAAGPVSGFRTPERPTHDGVDLGAARYTPILAVSAGTVIRVVCNVSAGTCDVDGNRKLKGCGWYVEVQHAGNVVTRYCHLVRKPVVVVGQRVTAGEVLGHVGTSGSSSGPHLHFEVHLNAPPATSANAVSPVVFMRARGVQVS
jgi:peptidase M23-like protein